MGICVFLESHKGKLSVADSRFPEGEHKNRGDIRYEQRHTIHIIPSA